MNLENTIEKQKLLIEKLSKEEVILRNLRNTKENEIKELFEEIVKFKNTIKKKDFEYGNLESRLASRNFDFEKLELRLAKSRSVELKLLGEIEFLKECLKLNTIQNKQFDELLGQFNNRFFNGIYKPQFMIELLPEETEIRGNALASGDPKTDLEYENEIIERINNGDFHSWCYVRVTAQFGKIEVHSHLNEVSFSDLEYHNLFPNLDEWFDLDDAIIPNLIRNCETVFQVLLESIEPLLCEVDAHSVLGESFEKVERELFGKGN